MGLLNFPTSPTSGDIYRASGKTWMWNGVSWNVWDGSSIAFPVSLFTAGTDGFFYDFSDLTTLFQDTSGTTPVTTNNDPVGRILDKSGKTNHSNRYSADANRALWQSGTYPYILFDGSSDAYDLSLTLTKNKSYLTCCCAIRATSSASEYVVQFNTNSGDNDRYAVAFGAGRDLLLYGRRLDADSRVSWGGATPATDGVDFVFTTEGNWNDGTATVSLNQTANGPSAWTSAGLTTNADSNKSTLGSTVGTGSFFTGRMYAVFVIDKLLTSGERTQLITYMGSKMGLSI